MKTYDEILNSGGPAVVLFTSATCGPCRRLKPRMAALAATHGFALHTLDVADEVPAVRALALRGVPSVLAVLPGGGFPQLLFTGERSDEDVLDALRRAGVLPA